MHFSSLNANINCVCEGNLMPLKTLFSNVYFEERMMPEKSFYSKVPL